MEAPSPPLSPSNSLQLPARSTREHRLPTRLGDYHLGTPEEEASPPNIESNPPQPGESVIVAPEAECGTEDEADDEGEESLQGDVSVWLGGEIIPPDAVVPLEGPEPRAFRPGEFYYNSHLHHTAGVAAYMAAVEAAIAVDTPDAQVRRVYSPRGCSHSC